MLEHWGFTLPAVLRRHRDGPLGAYVDAFAARLRDQGYVRCTARYQIQLIGALGRWLKRQGINAQNLDERLIDHFFRSRRRRRSGDWGTLRALLKQLQEAGVIKVPRQRAVDGPFDPIRRAYQKYLETERRLASSTVTSYLHLVHTFLSARFGNAKPRFANLNAHDITHFVRCHAPKHSRGRAKLMVTSLRSFFRFLRLQGEITLDLAACVPTVPNWRQTGLPQALTPQEVKRLLNSCERRTHKGRRNFAILLLLARLGLRSGEITNLTLEDLDWAAGEITVEGKSRRRIRLPLPSDAGRALADYLRHGRPRCATRRVFVRSVAPHVGFSGSGALASLVRRALVRAGLNPLHKGPHLLRHTLATQMLRRGATLTEIGEILRHRHPDTTAIYAKVDLQRLRILTRRWPGGAV